MHPFDMSFGMSTPAMPRTRRRRVARALGLLSGWAAPWPLATAGVLLVSPWHTGAVRPWWRTGELRIWTIGIRGVWGRHLWWRPQFLPIHWIGVDGNAQPPLARPARDTDGPAHHRETASPGACAAGRWDVHGSVPFPCHWLPPRGRPLEVDRCSERTWISYVPGW